MSTFTIPLAELAAGRAPARRLDCNTPTGQKFIEEQNKTAKLLADYSGTVHFCTPGKGDKADAPTDVLFGRGNTLVAVAEIKSRRLSLPELEAYSTLTITKQKLADLSQLCALLRVPGYVVVRCLYDEVVLYWKICDDVGNFCCEFTSDRTVTRENCNEDKLTTRLNAFLPVSSGRRLGVGPLLFP